MGIDFQNVSFSYNKKASKSLSNNATLNNINLEIKSNDEFIMILGHTGSGKSTLVQHMNALLLPNEGEIHIYDKVIKPKSKIKLKAVRSKIGLVFQFPEYQLFQDTVLKDISFGPHNFGLSKDESIEKAKEAAKLVGLDETIYEKSPFNLSGGQMRRVAIAGILASNPEILILDEPTVGLDPQGKEDLMNILVSLQEKTHKSIIMISHDMNVVAKFAKRVIVMNHGKVVYDGSKEELFNNHEILDHYNLALPDTSKLALALKQKGLIDYQTLPLTKEELISIILKGEYHE